MIYFIRFKDVPQFLVGSAISIGFLLILVPVWIANPGLVSSPTALLLQVAFIVTISMIAASVICKSIKRQAQGGSAATMKTEATRNSDTTGWDSPPAQRPRAVSAPPQINNIDSHVPKPSDAAATQTPKAAAESVAQLIGETFSSSRFTELFKDGSFADGWKLGDGLGVWYFLGTVSLDAAVWTTFNSQDKIDLILNTCDSFLSKQWRMSENVLERFNDVRQNHAKSAFFAYTGCKSGAGLATFCSRFANLILGAKLPAELPFEGTTMECMLKGYEPISLDPSLTLPISDIFTKTTIAAKKLLQEPAIAWPASTLE